ncbi:MAG: hypothetical protein E3J72_13585 [Planctomycetota bacterium]|nr:MAG: hypothetical protein E3J72_13585 [Planctomycetota bacterium]
MCKNAKWLALGIICLLLVILIHDSRILAGNDKENGKKDRITNGLTGLASKQLGDRVMAASEIGSIRRSIIKGLLVLASQNVKPIKETEENASIPIYPRHDSKHLAIELLGEYKAEKAVKVLIKNIDYKVEKQIAGGFTDWFSRYPAANALVKIGLPSVDPLIFKIKRISDNLNMRKVCCWTLNKILGKKMAVFMLKEHISATGGNHKENLEAALKIFEKYE